MGNRSSSSTIKDTIEQTIDSSVNVVQGQSGSQVCSQGFTFDHCIACESGLKCENDFKKCSCDKLGDLTVDMSCDQNFFFTQDQTAKVSQSIQQQFAQTLNNTAESKGQNLSLAPSNISADSTVDSTAKLATTVSTNIKNGLSSDGTTSQMANLSYCAAKDFYFPYVSIQDLTSSQTQDSVVNSSIAQSLSQDITNSSKAEEENAITSDLIALAVCLLIFFLGPAIAVLLLGGETAKGAAKMLSRMTHSATLGAFIFGIIIFWLSLSIFNKSWPCYKSCWFSEIDENGKQTGLWDSKCCANGNDVKGDGTCSDTSITSKDVCTDAGNTWTPSKSYSLAHPPDKATKDYCGKARTGLGSHWWWPFSSGTEQGDLLDSKNCRWWKDSDDHSQGIEKGGCVSKYRMSGIICLVIAVILFLICLVIAVKHQGEEGEGEKKDDEVSDVPGF